MRQPNGNSAQLDKYLKVIKVQLHFSDRQFPGCLQFTTQEITLSTLQTKRGVFIAQLLQISWTLIDFLHYKTAKYQV